jgi:AraC family transcriptional regulator of adaptative response/methylated-DNA-[protein]-cysteine methyltransferase
VVHRTVEACHDRQTTPEAAYHYRVIARAIRDHRAAGPGLTLDALAGELGMSPAHFQRVFSRWAGVSPKRFQQYLALGHAKALLAERHTVLDATLATGLSGTGRMHDLFLRWEAMSPGDYARGGAGLDIAWGAFDSPFGEVVAMGTDRGLCGLGFAAETGRQAALTIWPSAGRRRGSPRRPGGSRPGSRRHSGAAARRGCT